MVLDTSHLTYDVSTELLKNYNKNIKTIHLSQRDEKKGLHQPIDDFCINVVKTLNRENWNGKIFLEYMPQFQEQVADDIKKLNKVSYLEKGIMLAEKNKLEAAIESFEKADSIETNAMSLYGIGSCVFRGLTLNPNNKNIHYSLDDAIDMLKKAFDLKPTNPEDIYFFLGYAQLGKASALMKKFAEKEAVLSLLDEAKHNLIKSAEIEKSYLDLVDSEIKLANKIAMKLRN